MLQYRVAFSGAFDIANYGDHLFPYIFKKWMLEHGIECQVDLFSPTEAQSSFQNNATIYATKSIQQKHEKRQYDAIVVSGGALIHFRSIFQKMNAENDDFQAYPIFETWVIPSLAAGQCGVPLLWNCPGVPYDFSVVEAKLTKELLRKVDFIAVRNEESAQALNIGLPEGKHVLVSPDPAFLLPRYYPMQKMMQRLKRFNLSEKYIVCHTHRFIPEETFDQLLETLLDLYERGGKSYYYLLHIHMQTRRCVNVFMNVVEKNLLCLKRIYC